MSEKKEPFKIIDPCRYCSVPGCNQPADRHHTKTRAVLSKVDWKKDEYQVDLCRRHHTEVHTIGPTSFCSKYNMPELLEQYKRDNWRLR